VSSRRGGAKKLKMRGEGHLLERCRLKESGIHKKGEACLEAAKTVGKVNKGEKDGARKQRTGVLPTAPECEQGGSRCPNDSTLVCENDELKDQEIARAGAGSGRYEKKTLSYAGIRGSPLGERGISRAVRSSSTKAIAMERIPEVRERNSAVKTRRPNPTLPQSIDKDGAGGSIAKGGVLMKKIPSSQKILWRSEAESPKKGNGLLIGVRKVYDVKCNP